MSHEELQKLIKSYIPMTEASFLVLSSLVHENHGYGIMMEAARLTEGRVNLGAGTVYTLIYKMEGDGLISPIREEERRKIYSITPEGLAVLQAESARLTQSAKIAEQALRELQPV